MLIFQSFYKVMYFVRIYDSVAFIITILTNICYEALPLVLFMLSLLIGFVKINTIFHVAIDEDNDPTKGQVDSELTKRFYMLFMNTQGSITAPYLSDEMEERYTDDTMMLFILYAFITVMFLSC